MAAKKSVTPVLAPDMTWEQFAAAKTRTTRVSQYDPFMLALAARKVYDATATFPGIKAGTISSALYKHAKKHGIKIAVLLRDDRVIVTLIESVKKGA